ncbi:MAG: hypothetical protein KF718_29455 [Polyangiaceae bacterium]|nr:hypothetical protein [Polyangiaceae bacterium]
MSTEQDSVNAGAIGTLVALLTFAVVGVALAVTALVRAEADAEVAGKQPAGMHVAIVKPQKDSLTEPAAWVDQGKGEVSIPIERAMELTAKALREDPESATAPAPAPVAPAPGEADGGATPEASAPEAPAPEAPAPEAPAPEAPAPKAPAPKKPIAPPKPPPPPAPEDGP